MDKTEIIKEIKKKKELSGISDSVILPLLDKYVSNKFLANNLSKFDKKIIITDLRSELRKMAGRFNTSSVNLNHPLEKKDYHTLISLHSSTKERLDFYPEIKSLLDSLNIKSVLDLGCGLNPLVLAKKDLEYYASDIKEDELDIIRSFFKEQSITGKVFIQDLREKFSPPKTDICLLFKVVDLLDKKGHKNTELLLNRLNSKYIFISFPTKTLSGKPMNHPQRGWIERLLTRLNFKFRTINSKNEIFYLAEKI